MARKATAFTQAGIARAVKGVEASGAKVARVELEPDGRIVVVTAEAAATHPESPLDKWMASRGPR